MNIKAKTFQTLSLLLILGILLPSIDRLNAEEPKTDSGGDRSQNAGAASAAAAAGAAMAGLGCVMGLKAAQEAPPDQKAMLQMMAMQQCAQAAQNAAAANQNKDQKNALDGNNQPQSKPFEVPKMEEPKDDETPDFSKLVNNNDTPSSTTPPENNYKPVEIPVPVETPVAKVPEFNPGQIGPVLPKTSTPEMVEPGTITAKKDDDNSNSGSEASKVLGNALAGRGSADDLLKKALADSGTNPNQQPTITPKSGRNRSASNESGAEGGGGGGGGSSGGSEKGNDPFENLLSQMLGGGQPGAIEGGFQGGMDLATLPAKKKGQPKMNIFQFASTVYSELAHTANRVKMRPNRKSAPTERSLSSVTTSVMNAQIR